MVRNLRLSIRRLRAVANLSLLHTAGPAEFGLPIGASALELFNRLLGLYDAKASDKLVGVDSILSLAVFPDLALQRCWLHDLCEIMCHEYNRDG